jgi:hypothetical protein
MRKLWSASNVKIYGRGVSEVGYLDELSRLIGQYSYINVSRSHSRTESSSSSRQESKDEIHSARACSLSKFGKWWGATRTVPRTSRVIICRPAVGYVARVPNT